MPLHVIDHATPIECLIKFLVRVAALSAVFIQVLVAYVPPCLSHVTAQVAEQTGLVHQFFGDAAYIHARAAKSPRGALRGRFDLVCQCNSDFTCSYEFGSCHTC